MQTIVVTTVVNIIRETQQLLLGGYVITMMVASGECIVLVMEKGNGSGPRTGKSGWPQQNKIPEA
jgi:hypothetical protein